MFYLIQFEKVDKTKNIIVNTNNNILSHCKYIKISKLQKDKVIIWLEDNIIQKNTYLFTNFLRTNDILCFIELKNILKTPYDFDWKWDDKFMTTIFKSLL